MTIYVPVWVYITVFHITVFTWYCCSLAIECVLTYYRMCSLAIECVLLL